MNSIIRIPKGKNILKFLQELDGTNKRTKDAWIFLHRNLLQELIIQCGNPDLSIVDGNCSFSLHYGPDHRHVGSLVVHTEMVCDTTSHPLWFFVTAVCFDEDSPVKFAFHSPHVYPSEALFLASEE